MGSRILRRAGVVLAFVVAAVLAAGPAFAHVTVNPDQAVQGGFAKLAFRVPTEKDNANTVKLDVSLPANAPIAFVSTRPLPGWTVSVEKTKLATPIRSDDGDVSEVVSKITWTAQAGAGIQPGQFQEFEVSVGPLPAVDTIVFKVLQTYSDGDVVRWIDEPSGDKEPEHPAPELTLSKGTGADLPGASGSAAKDTAASRTTVAIGLGGAGLVAGLAGLVLGLLGYRRAGAVDRLA